MARLVSGLDAVISTPSINVRKAMWTARLIGLDLDREDWGAGFRSPQEPEYLALESLTEGAFRQRP